VSETTVIKRGYYCTAAAAAIITMPLAQRAACSTPPPAALSPSSIAILVGDGRGLVEAMSGSAAGSGAQCSGSHKLNLTLTMLMVEPCSRLVSYVCGVLFFFVYFVARNHVTYTK